MNIFKHDYDGDVIVVGVAGTSFRATGNHPIWVVDGEALDQRTTPEHAPDAPTGSLLRGRWIEVRDLRVGDVLLLRGGEEKVVESLAVGQEALRVYNLEVAEDHTYAVGEAQVLVHNKPLEFVNPPDKPVGKLSKVDDGWFRQRGIDGEQHALKDAVGARPVSRFDIFKDRDNNLWVLPKNGRGEPQWTARWIDE